MFHNLCIYLRFFYFKPNSSFLLYVQGIMASSAVIRVYILTYETSQIPLVSINHNFVIKVKYTSGKCIFHAMHSGPILLVVSNF